MTLRSRVVTALRGAGTPHALIGAGALAVHGVTRATLDFDLFVLDSSCRRATPEGDLLVVRAADLILLKLFAGGAQDAWDIQQLLEGEDRAELIEEVEKLLPELPAQAAKLWRRILES